MGDIDVEETGTTEACPRCGEQISSEAEACPACGDLRVSVNCVLHPDRTAVGQCVVCGTAVCEECRRGTDRYFLCDVHRDVRVMQGWAQVYTTSEDMEAQLIRQNLEAEGIDARVISQKDHFSLPVDLGDLTGVRVLVPAFDFADATALISEHMDAAGEVRFGSEDEEPLP